MKCANCPNVETCEDPARHSGGCDIDGADDFGADPIEKKVKLSEEDDER